MKREHKRRREGIESRKQRAESREQRAESRGQRAESREQRGHRSFSNASCRKLSSRVWGSIA
jgi:hypothetical protein